MCLKNAKKAIYEHSREQLAVKCSVKAPIITEMATRVGWSRIWDATLDLGEKSVRSLQYISRVMSHHGGGDRPCPLSDATPLHSPVLQHLLYTTPQC